jgi:hypothetical protein
MFGHGPNLPGKPIRNVKSFAALDDGGELEVGGAGGEVVEEALAAAEQDRHLVDDDLVEQARGDRLLQGRGAADRDVLVVGRLLGFADRLLRSLADEVEAVPAFELLRGAGDDPSLTNSREVSFGAIPGSSHAACGRSLGAKLGRGATRASAWRCHQPLRITSAGAGGGRPVLAQTSA